MNKTEKQIKELESYLMQVPRITLAETEELLDISESTVRRLYARMEQQGLAFRVHGGLQALPERKQAYNFQNMEMRCLAQKKRIAREAIREIGDAGVLFLDSGSTVYQFSLCLADWLRAGRRGRASVFTNSLRNLQALSGLTDVQLIGGKYRENRQDCCGYLAEETLRKLTFDLCIMGVDGCDAEQGVSCMDMETASLARNVVGRSLRRVVLADSTKCRRGAMVSYAAVEDLDLIITDQELEAETVERLQARGTTVRLV